MTSLPKRRKYKDNPYILKLVDNHYYIMFKDGLNIHRTIEVNKKIFDLFNQFELEDLHELNEYDRHIEHSQIYDNTLYHKLCHNYYSLEDDVEKRLFTEELKQVIKELPKVQRRRIIKYFFEDKTFEEIANEEGCTKRAVKFSVDIAIEKISKIFKK